MFPIIQNLFFSPIEHADGDLFKLSICIVFGLLIGSFLNVCIYRIPRGESINWPPSHCPNCKTRLKPVDLVPVLSYLFLRGRCRTCKTKISWGYPIIELTNALLYALIVSCYGLTPLSVVYMVTASVLLVISKIDQETETIPDELNVVIFILGFVALVLKGIQLHALDQIVGLLLGGGFFLGLAIVTGGAMGGGDIKLMAALGWLTGWKAILQITLFSFILGAIGSIVLIILKIKGRKDTIPFGPFIALAAIVFLLWGDTITQMYLRMTGL